MSNIDKKRLSLIKSCGLLIFFLVLVLSSPALTFAGGAFGTVVQTLRDNTQFYNLWAYLVNAVNSFVVLILIVVAFCEILRININTYGFKKVFPTLLLALVAANFSYIFCRILVDLAAIGVNFFWNASIFGHFSTVFTDGAINNSTGILGNIGTILTVLILMLYYLAVVIALVLLWLLFLVRNYLIYALTFVSPIAFMCMVLPQTKSLFNKWITELMRWVFMPVPSYMFLWLGGEILTQIPATPLLAGLMAAGCIYGAVMVPFKLGGVAMGKWSELLKGVPASVSAFAQKKAATAESTGNVGGDLGFNKGGAVWNKPKTWLKGSFGSKGFKAMSNVAGFLNPETYTQGVKARLEGGATSRGKAIKKTDMFGTMAGPERQLDANFEANKDDDAAKSALEIGTAAKKMADDVKSGTKDMTKARVAQLRIKAKAASTNPDEKRTEDMILDEMIVTEMRETSAEKLLDLYGPEFTAKELGEFKSKGSAFSKARGTMDRKERDRAFYGPGYTPTSPSTPMPAAPSNSADAEAGTKATIEGILDENHSTAALNPEAAAYAKALMDSLGSNLTEILEDSRRQLIAIKSILGGGGINPNNPEDIAARQTAVDAALGALKGDNPQAGLDKAAEFGYIGGGSGGGVNGAREFLGGQKDALGTLSDLASTGQLPADVGPAMIEQITSLMQSAGRLQVGETLHTNVAQQEIASRISPNASLAEVHSNPKEMEALQDSLNHLADQISDLHGVAKAGLKFDQGAVGGMLEKAIAHGFTNMGQVFRDERTWKSLLAGMKRTQQEVHRELPISRTRTDL